MRIRILLVAAVGILLIGVLCWSLVAPADEFGVVSLISGRINISDSLILLFLSFICGFACYFLSWPYGREIGILAVPFGLAVWSFRSGSLANLFQLNPAASYRAAAFTVFKWEPLFWLAFIAAGALGTVAAHRLAQIHYRPSPTQPGSSAGAHSKPSQKSASVGSKLINFAIALVCSAVIASFFIRLLAQDVRLADTTLGSVIAQPQTTQIAFAVLVSFGLSAFVVKRFLNASFIAPIIAAALLPCLVIIFGIRPDILDHLVRNWPAVFFPAAALSILPVQMVSFGTLGAVWGYWLAVSYTHTSR